MSVMSARRPTRSARWFRNIGEFLLFGPFSGESDTSSDALGCASRDKGTDGRLSGLISLGTERHISRAICVGWPRCARRCDVHAMSGATRPIRHAIRVRRRTRTARALATRRSFQLAHRSARPRLTACEVSAATRPVRRPAHAPRPAFRAAWRRRPGTARFWRNAAVVRVVVRDHAREQRLDGAAAALAGAMSASSCGVRPAPCAALDRWRHARARRSPPWRAARRPSTAPEPAGPGSRAPGRSGPCGWNICRAKTGATCARPTADAQPKPTQCCGQCLSRTSASGTTTRRTCSSAPGAEPLVQRHARHHHVARDLQVHVERLAR